MSDGSRHDENPLTGRWRRVTELPSLAAPETITFGQDPTLFPELIEFSGTRYQASKAPDQAFIVWDAGNYRLEGDELAITLANDAFAKYSIEFAGDEFSVIDATGHRTTYRRVP